MHVPFSCASSVHAYSLNWLKSHVDLVFLFFHKNGESLIGFVPKFTTPNVSNRIWAKNFSSSNFGFEPNKCQSLRTYPDFGLVHFGIQLSKPNVSTACWSKMKIYSIH